MYKIKEKKLKIRKKYKLPFDEIGKLIEIKNILWGFKYVMEITKGSVFNKVGDKVDFKREQIKEL